MIDEKFIQQIKVICEQVLIGLTDTAKQFFRAHEEAAEKEKAIQEKINSLAELFRTPEDIQEFTKSLVESLCDSAEKIEKRVQERKHWAIKQAPVLYVLLLDKRIRIHRIRNNC